MTQVNFRIEDDLKSEADYILDRIGISMSSALNIFIRQLIARRGIPFEVTIPDSPLSSPDRIRQAMQDYDNGRRNYHYHELPADEEAPPPPRQPRRQRRSHNAKAVV